LQSKVPLPDLNDQRMVILHIISNGLLTWIVTPPLLLLLLLPLLLLLEALQLQRSFGLLNEFLPFGPVSDAVLPVYSLFTSLFTSSSHLFFGLPSDLLSAGDHLYFFYRAVLWHAMHVSEPS
jgi:hypothetical protein